jgi:spore germination cell wall hydrolase CwlJ-like protein
MNRFFAGLALVATLFHPVWAFGDTNRKNTLVQEQEAAKSRSGQFFQALLQSFRSKNEPKPVQVDFSRAWLDAQPTASGDAQWACLSEALYFEARGETVKGQFAVGEVIVNRAKSDLFPDSLCGVIKQGTGRKFQCQFTYTCDGRKEVIAEPEAYQRVAKVARVLIDGMGEELTDGATYYHTTSVRPSWSRKFVKTTRIGVHVFYRPGVRVASNG